MRVQPFVPAKAGTQSHLAKRSSANWVPAFAGTNG